MTDSANELTFDLDDDLYAHLEAEAAKLELPVDEHIKNLLIEYMSELSDEEGSVC
jgi:hypothetical protein